MIVKNSVAVVTGGASGLGEACVRNLNTLGAKVAIFDFVAERGEKIAAELGKDVIFAHTDVARCRRKGSHQKNDGCLWRNSYSN